MKKIIVLILAVLIVMTLLTACGKEDPQVVTTAQTEIFSATEDTKPNKEPIELLSTPIRVEVMVVRLKSVDNAYETFESVEQILFTSVLLDSSGITVVYEKPVPLDRYDCIYVNVAQFAGAPYVEADEDRPVCAVMKDGTQINFFQYEGGKDISVVRADRSLVLDDIDYLQFYDGTRLFVPEA